MADRTMLEREEWLKFIKRYPDANARRAADKAADIAMDHDPGISVETVAVIWNDEYLKHSPIHLKGKK